MPCHLTDIGVNKSDKTFNEYYEHICNSSAINKEDKAECDRIKGSLYAESLYILINNMGV